jgi:hypothetical protein
MINELTKFQALYVMYLRCRCNGTWGYVALMFTHRYNLKRNFGQRYGRKLCELAEEILNVEPNSITEIVL